MCFPQEKNKKLDFTKRKSPVFYVNLWIQSNNMNDLTYILVLAVVAAIIADNENELNYELLCGEPAKEKA